MNIEDKREIILGLMGLGTILIGGVLTYFFCIS